MELEVQVPPAELVDVGKLRLDGENPNRMGKRQFVALKKSIQRYGFVVPVITNRDLLVADGEHRLRAAKDLGMKQVSVVRLPVDEVDRRLIRQVMNKLRGEHDLFLDAEEYYRIVSEDQRGLLRELLNESDLRIENLLRLREPFHADDGELRAVAERFTTRVESSRLERPLEKVERGEPLTLKCHVEFSTKAEVTERTLGVCEAFGLGVDEAKPFLVFDEFSLDFYKGDLIYITGDSGGGKSLLLKAFKAFFGEEAIGLDDVEIRPEETLVDGVGGDLKQAIEILSMCGLNDAFLFLRKYKELSDGQRYRYRLAKLLDQTEKSVWLVDEFCATLDRVMARIIAFLVQKVARQLGKTVVLATAHQDLVEDFKPDVVVVKGFERDVEVKRMPFEPRKCSILEQVRVEAGGIEDYERLKRFHYRSKDDGGEGLRVRTCYHLVLGGQVIGVIVYSRSYLNLKPRNLVFGDRYVFTPGDLHRARLINEEIARISRVVVHPKFRGIGLGELLVRETLPMVGAKVVEVLAVMAEYNPVFEKAGMQKVEYARDRSALEERIRSFVAARGFDFSLGKSKRYCQGFFARLEDRGREELVELLSEFARQPFIKNKSVSPELLTRMFSSHRAYLYWIGAS